MTLIRHLIRLFIPATVPEKNVKSTKKQSADYSMDNSARNVRFDPSRNDKNDNYADPDDAGEKFFMAGGVTAVLKVEEGKTVDGGGKETSIPSQRPRADANRNYKNSQRQEADKSYAERKLIEIETKQIETANNKIKLQNKAEAASKWVLNSLLNIENSPNRKDLKVVEKAENQNPNGNGNKNENKYENQNESDEGGADTNTDTSGDNSVLLNSLKKNSNIIYGQEQIKKLSKSSGGTIFSKQSDGSKLEGEGITDERATSAASRDDIGMSGVDINIKLSNDKSFDLNEVEDKKVKSDEKKGRMTNNFEKDRKDTESKELKIKYKDGASIQNIQNDALTQTLTAVVTEKSSNSYSAKPNLNVILKRSLKDSLYPINTDGTYTTKETVRPINEYNPIDDFVQNSITISEKVELEKKQNRLTENNEEISERDGFVNNQTREDSSNENDADESKKGKDEEGEGEGEKKEESKGDTISDSLATEDEMMEMKMETEMKNIPPTKDSTGEIIELEGRNPTSVSTVTDIPKAQDGMSISLSSSTQENIYDNGNADAKDSRGDILRVEIEKEEKVRESSVHVDSNAGYNGRDNSNGNEERSTDASLPSDTDDGYLLPPVGTTHSNSPPPHSAPPAAVPSLPLASSLASTAFSIPIIAQFAVEDSSQESNSLLKEKYVKVEEVELGSDSGISPVSSSSPSLSLPTSAEIRIQLISAAAEELGIGEDNSGSDGEIGDVRGGEKVKSQVGAGEESEAVEAEKGLASPTSEYSSFPYYTPPPPPTSTAPRCMLGSWELSESRYMDEDRCVHTLRVLWVRFLLALFPLSFAEMSIFIPLQLIIYNACVNFDFPSLYLPLYLSLSLCLSLPLSLPLSLCFSPSFSLSRSLTLSLSSDLFFLPLVLRSSISLLLAPFPPLSVAQKG